MDTSIQEKLRALIFKYTYREHITMETSINKDLCIEGDDAIDFLNEFVILFQVDITHFPFDEYFYNEGELSMIWFLKRFKKAKKPLTIHQLMEAIDKFHDLPLIV